MELIKEINREIEFYERQKARAEKSIRWADHQIAVRTEALTKIQRLAHVSSVAAFVSTDTGLVRAELRNGDPELDDEQATHLDDCCDEWFSSLSKADTLMVARVKYALRMKELDK